MESLGYYFSTVKNEIKSAFANNIFLLIFSTLVFLIPLLVGYYYPKEISSYIQPFYDSFMENIDDGTVTLTTNSLFINNGMVAVMLYALSALGAVLGLIVLANNGMFIGYFGTMYHLDAYLVLTLPHGIFEIPAIIIACTGGLVLLSFALHFIYNLIFPDYSYTDIFDPYFSDFKLSPMERVSASFRKNQNKIKESFIMLILSVVLLIIAAFIEANLTIPIASWIFAFFGMSL